MIRKIDDYFVLDTAHTTYCMQIHKSGVLCHLYYGRRLAISDSGALRALEVRREFAPGNTCVYDSEYAFLSLEDVPLEMSAYGKGDVREPMLEVIHADGASTSDFVYELAVINEGVSTLDTLPSAHGSNEEASNLCITLKCRQYGLKLMLVYTVFHDSDVITRSAKLLNSGEGDIHLRRLLSTQVELPGSEYVMTCFTGAWAREMNRSDVPVSAGRHSVSSYCGTSSSRANPFVMISAPTTTEDHGEAYGFNLIYSGNHYEALEVNPLGGCRFVSGINPTGFDFVLKSGEVFEAPEAVMTFSHDGFSGVSLHMQDFVRRHVLPSNWAYRQRPVLLNSWEAAYFDINEQKLLKLGHKCASVGIDLLVMDDGWFGDRADDTSSLGDWQVNKHKLPHGLKGLCDSLNKLGVDLGIWVEPEMVNVNSRLYQAHPDWTIQIPGMPHSEGRNQRILDLSRPEVQDFVIESVAEILNSCNIRYVKWDMNRIFSDYYSASLPSDRQGEIAHRYVLGLYRCMKELTERFPDVLFEGCASGGNRFDLGILSYFPQIWASDNTDAICRASIQNSLSYGYPLSCISAHVSSCPNHQTLRSTPLSTRFNVAFFGSLGYECNLCDMNRDELALIREQISLYKQWQEVILSGHFYRGVRGTSDVCGAGSSVGYGGGHGGGYEYGNVREWTLVAADRSRAVGLHLQILARPNNMNAVFHARGLDEDRTYHFYNKGFKINVKEFGDLVNTLSPIHIRQDSLIHNAVARIVKLNSEVEDYTLKGDMLMYAGVRLSPAFAGTGYNDKVRLYKDFNSRLYFME